MLALRKIAGANADLALIALVVGILIGTYSSIAVAAPMLVSYQQWRTKHGKTPTLPVGKRVKA